MSDQSIPRPKSATSPLIGLFGMISFAGIIAVLNFHPALEPYIRSIILVGGTAFTMIAADIIFNGISGRASTGLNWKNFRFNGKRTFIKICGLALSVLMIGACYLILPEYQYDKYQPVWNAVRFVLPLAIPLAFIYIAVIDAVMEKPQDGYYNFGLILLGQWKKVERALIAPHVRSWFIKGFFAPLMFIFLTNNMAAIQFNLDRDWSHQFMEFYYFAFFVIFSTDLAFTLAGYLFALRLIDTHERSSEPTVLGWVAALLCYPPIAYMVDRYYISYGAETHWLDVMQGHGMLLAIWGSIVIVLLTIYSWSTVAFGMRFSNLTHRGIITNGPYRFTKHPAYISKNLSWWLMAMPFIPSQSVTTSIGLCIMLLMMNGIYAMRAYTEERHLARDPVYRDYQAYILKHGIFRCLPFKMAAKPLELS